MYVTCRRTLRFEWDEAMSTVNVEHLDLSVPYGNEFLGTPEHILLTPILERTAFALASTPCPSALPRSI